MNAMRAKRGKRIPSKVSPQWAMSTLLLILMAECLVIGVRPTQARHVAPGERLILGSTSGGASPPATPVAWSSAAPVKLTVVGAWQAEPANGFTHSSSVKTPLPTNTATAWLGERAPPDADLLASSAKGPPVYKSAPKKVSSLESPPRRANSDSSTGEKVVERPAKLKIATTKKKPTVKRKKTLKKVKVVIKKRAPATKSWEPPKASERHHHGAPVGEPPKGAAGGALAEAGGGAGGESKYYEYRLVPAEGAWKFGLKRGNKQHEIRRKESANKSHFRSEFEWRDKTSKGQHVFEYNHAGHEKRRPGKAAPRPGQRKQAKKKLRRTSKKKTTKKGRQKEGAKKRSAKSA